MGHWYISLPPPPLSLPCLSPLLPLSLPPLSPSLSLPLTLSPPPLFLSVKELKACLYCGDCAADGGGGERQDREGGRLETVCVCDCVCVIVCVCVCVCVCV